MVCEEHRFGPYVAAHVVGRGAMGTVYEALHSTLGKRVAVKALNSSLSGDLVAEARFLREARAVACISHPHVVNVFDVGVEAGRPFLVMELLEGETLDALLARGNRIGVERAVELLLPVVSAVAAIHDAGVVHRDLKPGNIMLARRGRFAVEPVVLDFGVSRSRDEAPTEAALTDPGGVLGTLAYLSPEQMRDARAAAPASDQYALGVVLYECLTGRNPFAIGDRYELMHATMTATVTPPSAVNPAIPAELDRIVLRALARRPDARYPTVRALGSALLSFADRSTWKRWAAEMAAADPAAAGRLDETVSDDVRLQGGRRPGTAALGWPRARRAVIPISLAGLLLAAMALLGFPRGRATARALAPSPTLSAADPAPVRDPIDDGPRGGAARAPEPAVPEAPLSAAPASPSVARRAGPSRRERSIAAAAVAHLSGPAKPERAAVSGGPVRKPKLAENAGDDDAIDPFAPVR